MKRAAVWKGQASGTWHVDTIDERTVMRCKRFLVYTEALAHALHKVGLTPTNPEKEQNR